MELMLIRHGLPEKVVNKDGVPADPPLSREGHDQAGKMANWLKNEAINRLYTSPMRRAFQTGEPLAAALSLDLEVEAGVAEYDQNSEHYIPIEELKALDYERWRRLMEGEVDIDFPAFAETVVVSLNRIAEENRGKRVAVTCHGGVVNVWAAHVLGLPAKLFCNPNYTSISRFMVSSSGVKSIITLNEHAHLR